MNNPQQTILDRIFITPVRYIANKAAAGNVRHKCLRIKCAALILGLVGTAVPAFSQTTNVIDVYNVTGTTVPAVVNSVMLTSAADNKARLTVAVNETGTNVTSLRINIGGGETVLTSSITNFVDPDYYITNYYDLTPSAATLTPTGVPATGGGSQVVLGTATIINTNADAADFDVSVALNYTNISSGDYDMAIEAAGVNSWRYPLPVKAGYKWNAGGGANTNFNNVANWVGGVVPGSGDIVILDNAGTVETNNQPTIAVGADTVIGSVSDIHTGDNYTHWNIAAGATLSILGDDGFRQLNDIIDVAERSPIRVSGAGTMVVSNANAEFNLITTRQNSSYDNADFSGLNTLILDVKKIAFNDIAAYPNIGTNGVVSRPFRNVYDMDWALTNIIRATFTDANGWTNDTRDYSMVINRQNIYGQTGSDGGMHFGLWNELNVNSMLWGGYSQMENPQVDFRSTNSFLKIRGVDGVSRAANLTIADAADYFATGRANGGGTKVNVTLTSGTVDALIDTFIVGRNPRVTDNGPASGRLTLGAGVFDINNAFLGYQTGAVDGTESGSAIGRVDVNNGGLFRVNGTLVLGYTETNTATVVDTSGQLNINSGSVAQINAVTVGGPANSSTANRIGVSGGTLIISNMLGTAAAPVQTLALSSSTLVLHVNGAHTDPYVYATTLTIGGTANTIKLASIADVTGFPKTIPLISYSGSAAPNFNLELPSGFYGYILNNTTDHTIDAVITTTAPKGLVWNGSVNGSWDQSTANWKDGKIFADGDSAIFDDTATGTTAVTVAGIVTAGSEGVVVTNDAKAYSFSGGTLAGSATLTKEGVNSLTVDLITELAVIANGGTVNGSGTLGATTIGTDAVLDYSGTINKLTTRGHSTSSGTINIGLSVADGIMDNAGSVNGTFGTSGNSITINRASGTITHSGVATIDTGATLINDGRINNGTGNANSRLSIKGYLSGNGVVSDTTGDIAGNNGRLEINAGAVFTPGGSNTIGSFSVEGRFDLNAGTPDGLMIIDVDLADPQVNDFIAVDKWSNMRGALLMNNIGTIPFAAGQSFHICRINFGGVNTPETAFDLANKIRPGSPGVGLQWDISNLRTNGVISIVTAPSTPPPLTTTFTGGTNVTLNWPSTHLGYQLQAQTNSLSVGLTGNWFPISGSESVTNWTVTIDPAAPAVFYRLSNQ